MRDGSSFSDRFLDKKSNYIFFKEHGKIAKKKIRSMTLLKNLTQTLAPLDKNIEKNSKT